MCKNAIVVIVDGIEDACVFGVCLVMYAFFSLGIFLIFHLSIWKLLMGVCVSGDILECPSVLTEVDPASVSCGNLLVPDL